MEIKDRNWALYHALRLTEKNKAIKLVFPSLATNSDCSDACKTLETECVHWKSVKWDPKSEQKRGMENDVLAHGLTGQEWKEVGYATMLFEVYGITKEEVEERQQDIKNQLNGAKGVL